MPSPFHDHGLFPSHLAIHLHLTLCRNTLQSPALDEPQLAWVSFYRRLADAQPPLHYARPRAAWCSRADLRVRHAVHYQ
jgi:hypothetical protein